MCLAGIRASEGEAQGMSRERRRQAIWGPKRRQPALPSSPEGPPATPTSCPWGTPTCTGAAVPGREETGQEQEQRDGRDHQQGISVGGLPWSRVGGAWSEVVLMLHDPQPLGPRP